MAKWDFECIILVTKYVEQSLTITIKLYLKFGREYPDLK
jgi:hypothetical protein